jgi:hypothetical protein
MSKLIKRTKLGLGATTAGVLVALAALLVLAGTALAAAGPTGASAALTSPTAAADGSATVTLTMTAPSGSAVGNWAFDVGYTAADYTGAPTCTGSVGDCNVNPGGSAGIVRFAGFGSALTGTTTVGQIVFKTSLTNGACSNLTLAIAAAAGSTFQDSPNGNDFTNPAFTVGKVCAVPAVTNSPSPSPSSAASSTASPKASPTVTPASVPNSGGPLGSSSSISLAWLLGAAGLFVVAGGAWTLARARREEN